MTGKHHKPEEIGGKLPCAAADLTLNKKVLAETTRAVA